MARIIVHDVKNGAIEREEATTEREAREAATLIEVAIESETQGRTREENKTQRMQRAVARVLLGYKRNNNAGSWNKFLTDVMAKFDELGGDV